MTADDVASRALWFGPDGALAAANHPDALAIECSTLSHDWVLELSRPGTVIVADNMVRGGRVLEADSDDASVQGTRRFFEIVAADPRLDATAVQTVGRKGWDGYVLAIVIRMPELGRISREEAAALAGLAPFDHDSGKHRGQRHIAGGRGRLRRSLFAAALPAAFRWNKALIALYARLTARGKAHNAALVACARKLIVYANTVVERGTPWVERPVTP